jgi:hypothetical protein
MSASPSTASQADQGDIEFGAPNLGDTRLTSLLVSLTRRLASTPKCSFLR